MRNSFHESSGYTHAHDTETAVQFATLHQGCCLYGDDTRMSDCLDIGSFDDRNAPDRPKSAVVSGSYNRRFRHPTYKREYFTFTTLQKNLGTMYTVVKDYVNVSRSNRIRKRKRSQYSFMAYNPPCVLLANCPTNLSLDSPNV